MYAMTMMKLTVKETAEFLLKNDNFSILSHRRPDGDTLGSTAALCLALRKLGKTAHVIENSETTDRFRWLHAGLSKAEAGENDTVVTVDVASPGMLPPSFEKYLGSIALRIDHHASATPFTDRELVIPESAACAEIVADLAAEMGVSLDAALADAIYVGTATDTGCFRFANTNAHTFAVAADCAAAGARVYQLNQELFETNTLGRLRIQAWIVEHLQLLRSGTMAICAIPKAVEEEIGVTEDDMDNISSFPRTVAGVCMASTLRETKEGDVKLSVRAIPGYDATVLTARFGGGGHKGAAGATLKMSLAEAAKAVEKAMLEL